MKEHNSKKRNMGKILVPGALQASSLKKKQGLRLINSVQHLPYTQNATKSMSSQGLQSHPLPQRRSLFETSSSSIGMDQNARNAQHVQEGEEQCGVVRFQQQGQENLNQGGPDISNHMLDQQEDQQRNNEVNPAKKKTRGPTTMSLVHTRSEAERKPIFLNAMNQPNGPTKKVVNEFSNFLGTLARNPTMTPLNVEDWRDVPDSNKEELWVYVQKRYIVPENAKGWVMKSIGSSWRGFKVRLKKTHFTNCNTDVERLRNRPKDIPQDQFVGLLEYWNSEKSKQRTAQNITNRRKQRDMHTVGSTSFAMVREEMKNQNLNKEEPSKLDIFKATRKRKPNRVYKVPNEVASQRIAELEEAIQSQGEGYNGKTIDPFVKVFGEEHSGRARLYGRGVNPSALREKKDKGDVVQVPADFMRLIREDLEVDMQRKLEAQKEELINMLVSGLQQSNPGLNINFNLSTCFPGGHSPGDALSGQHQQNQSLLHRSSAADHIPREQDGDDEHEECA